MNTNADDVYYELQRHLDRMPVPYPATESGIEIRILKHLFTPEEARLALSLSAIPEPLHAIHRRTRRNINKDQLRAMLDRMAEKGAIHKLGTREPLYAKAPLVIGMYEAQVDRLTPEFARDVRAYLDAEFGIAVRSVAPQLRTVPVNKSIPIERAISSYNDIRAFVQASPGPFAAQNCICRQANDLMGEHCRQTNERRNCLLFGTAARALIQKGVALEVTKQEMLDLLDRADRDGLVVEPQNTQEPMFVCCCCGCCCGVLTTAKKMARPADYFTTDFVAEVDPGVCEMCASCLERCQMDAIACDGEPARVLVERCIGCGLCVTTCPTGAAKLRQREAKKPPPKDTKSLYLTMFQERFGRLGTASALAGRYIGRKF